MAVQQVKNIVATTGAYMKDGVEKKRYLTVGSLFIYDDGGMSIKLDAVPTGFDGNLSVYDRDNNSGAQPNNGSAHQNQGGQNQGYGQQQQGGGYQQQQQGYNQQQGQH